MKEEKITNALLINRVRCVIAAITCSVLCILVFAAVIDQVLSTPDAIVSEVGQKSFRMFTILANMLMGVTAAMCIPFAVDGMRYRNYHLPRWVVNLLYVGTNGVALTFLIAVTVLSPATSYYRMMLYSNNILFHTICPILSIILFLFINTDHRIRFKASVLAILPVVIYALVYLVMVFAIGEESGGWRDHYQIGDIAGTIPIYLLFPLLCLVCFGVSTFLRVVHNAIHRKRKADMEKYYQRAEAFSYPDIRSAIGALADIDRSHDLGGELIVPRRIMLMMERKYNSGMSLREMCCIYIEEYFKAERKEDS
ncbi:MAG: hypothetical protein IJ863_03240 [Spirochaetales bacterium]|nr:hypothetical protein [Spirochaetales bacterium]